MTGGAASPNLPLVNEIGRKPASGALQPEGAFVVQLRSHAGGSGELAGRAEHVVSGEACRFESLAELLAFMSRVFGPAPGWEAGAAAPASPFPIVGRNPGDDSSRPPSDGRARHGERRR